MAEAYLQMSDQVAVGQDVTALSLLATAALGAYGVATDASIDDLAAVGLVGLSLNQGASYLQPAETSLALLNASERKYCIVGAGRKYADTSETNQSEVFATLVEAMTRSRIMLRQQLTRGAIPNYSQLLSDYRDSLRTEPPEDQVTNALKPENKSVGQDPVLLEKLRTELLGCLADNI